jgi:hypothetical protein
LIVEEATQSLLVAWETFYVIIGSSAAALTGLQFVVIALVAESRAKSTSREIAAFGTPTIIHFCAVLLVSAILSAPWQALSNASIALGACGVSGVVYAFIVVRRARRQTGYKPVLEDWLWHAVFPVIAHIVLLGAAVMLPRDPSRVLFVIGAAALLLLFVGIHNAWDAVIYITFERIRALKESGDESESRQDPAPRSG